MSRSRFHGVHIFCFACHCLFTRSKHGSSSIISRTYDLSDYLPVSPSILVISAAQMRPVSAMSTRPATRFVLLAFTISFAIAQAPADSTVVLGPSGTCPVPVEQTISVQLVIYSACFAGNTEIDPFGNGHTYTMNNAPTVFVVNTVLLTTIYHNGTTSVLPNRVAQQQAIFSRQYPACQVEVAFRQTLSPH